MKLNIIAALLLCASVATAASETTTTTTTATTSETAAPAAKAVKKAKKKAKKTEEKKDGAKVTPATTAPAASTVVPAANAAATSTAVAPAAAAPAKKWGVTLLNESSTDYNGGKDLGDATIKTTNYVGGSYKITANEKVGLRQYYKYNYDAKSDKKFESSDIKQSFTVATISTKTAGILGSDEILPMFWYYLPGHEAEANNFGKDMDNFYGILRADAEINWTLNPKWSVSYYANPRQTLGAKDEEAKFEAVTRLIHYANLYYNVSDVTQIYFNAGFDHRMGTESQTSLSDEYISALGASFGFLGGKVTLNPEISTSTMLKEDGQATADRKFYNKEATGYALTTVIAL